MWIEITVQFTAAQIIEAHEKLKEYKREVLAVDKMPGSGKLWINLNQVSAVQFCTERAVLHCFPDTPIEVHDPDETAHL